MQSLVNVTDRIKTHEIDGEPHEFYLSTWAMNEISARFGGFDKLESSLSLENPNLLKDVSFFLCVLANSAIKYANIRLPRDEQRELFDADYFLLRTSPFELAVLKDIIFECIDKGLERNIVSEEGEDSAKNESGA
jgi:hypothetical protein